MTDLPTLHDEGMVVLQFPEGLPKHVVYQAAFSGEEKRVLAIRENDACLFDTMTGALISRFSLAACRDLCKTAADRKRLYLTALALNGDGSQALLGFSSGDSFRIETASGTLLQIFPLPDAVKETPPQIGSPDNPWSVHALTFSPDDTLFAIAYTHRYIDVWRTSDGTLEISLHPPASLSSPMTWWEWTCSLNITPDNHYLFFAGRDRVAGIWDLLSQELVLEGADHADRIETIDEQRGVIRWATSSGKVWEATESIAPHRLLATGQYFISPIFTVDTRHIINSGAAGHCVAYRLPEIPMAQSLAQRQEGAPCIDDVVTLLARHRESGALPHNLQILLPRTHTKLVTSGCITIAGEEEKDTYALLGYIDAQQRLLAIVDQENQRICLIAVETGAHIRDLPIEHHCLNLAFSADSASLVVYEGESNQIRVFYRYLIWNTATGEKLGQIPADEFTSALTFTTGSHSLVLPKEAWASLPSPPDQLLSDGRLVVLAEGKVQIWRIPSELMFEFPHGYSLYNQGWFIPTDECSILLARPENIVERWSLENGELLHTYRVDTPHPQRLSFPSDEFYFTRNNLWRGPGGYYLTGEREGSHPTPKLDLSVDQRYAAIPYDPTHTHPYAAKEAILFDIQEDPPRPVASVAFKGELLAQRFTQEHVLQLNTAGEIYRSRLPAAPHPE
ncbi:MAG: hypothetical protein ACYDCO_14195 [Armatimonadota bacterium]